MVTTTKTDPLLILRFRIMPIDGILTVDGRHVHRLDEVPWNVDGSPWGDDYETLSRLEG